MLHIFLCINEIKHDIHPEIWLHRDGFKTRKIWQRFIWQHSSFHKKLANDFWTDGQWQKIGKTMIHHIFFTKIVTFIFWKARLVFWYIYVYTVTSVFPDISIWCHCQHVQTNAFLWNAKLTETQIYSELSI